MNFERRNSFSTTNASRFEGKLAYIKLNIQTPCPPSASARSYGATGVALSRLTREGHGRLFHSVPSGPNVGNECDCLRMPDGTVGANVAPQSGRVMIVGEEPSLEMEQATNHRPLMALQGSANQACLFSSWEHSVALD